MIVPFAGMRYERVAWPADGGAGAQDAWLTQALECVRDVRNAIEWEQSKPKGRKADTDDDDD